MWGTAKNQSVEIGGRADWWMNFQAEIVNFLQVWGKLQAEKRRHQLESLKTELSTITSDYQTNKNQDTWMKITTIKNEIEKIENYYAEGARIRSKLFEYEQAEKPTKYFFAKAKSKQMKTYIHQLKAHDGTIAQGLALMEVAKRYYSTLYSKRRTNKKAKQKLFKIIHNKLDEKLSTTLGQPLKLCEYDKAAKSLNNGKSPGYTGIPVEFYKSFPEILEGLQLVWEEALTIHQTPTTFQIGIITLIHKKGDKSEIANYRPITLLNTDYKIIAKCYATRLKTVISQLVGYNQRGFVPRRDIRANIMEVKLALEYAQKKKLSGALLMWDFEKAFDKLDRGFLWKTLGKMNIGKGFGSAMKTLHMNSRGVILINGYFSNSFEVNSGVRQGCPIAPFLFALTTEPLRNAVEKDTKFTGLMIKDIKVTLQLFADDTNGFISSATDMQRLDQHFANYEQASGHRRNISKCLAIVFGDFDKTILQQIRILSKSECETLLGLQISLMDTTYGEISQTRN